MQSAVVSFETQITRMSINHKVRDHRISLAFFSNDDALPFEACVFEILEQRQFETGGREVADHLCNMRVIE